MLNCVSTEEGTRITFRSGNFGAPNRTESGVQTSLNDWRHIWMFAYEFPQKKPLGFVIQSMLTLKVSVFLSLEYWIWSIQDYQMNLFISISHLTSRSRRIPLVRVVESTKYLNKLDYAAVFLPVLLVISGLSKSNRIHSGSLKADLLEYDKDALVEQIYVSFNSSMFSLMDSPRFAAITLRKMMLASTGCMNVWEARRLHASLSSTFFVNSHYLAL